jgi:hypothetical protein
MLKSKNSWASEIKTHTNKFWKKVNGLGVGQLSHDYTRRIET